MSRLTGAGLRAALSEWTTDGFLECLTLSATGVSPIRLVRNQIDVVRTAGTFIAFPFRSRLAPQTDQRRGRMEIIADNVDQRIVLALRELSEYPAIVFEVVRIGDPNDVQYGPLDLRVESMLVASQTVKLLCAPDTDRFADAFPHLYFAGWNASSA